MKSSSLFALGFLAATAISCAPTHSKSTDKMGQDLTVARSGVFGECIRQSEIATHSMEEAQFFKEKIDRSVVPQESWYYATGEKAAKNAIEQRQKAEEICGEYYATKFAGLTVKTPTKTAGVLVERVYFDLGSAQLTDAERRKLSNVITAVESSSASEIVLSGFTDTTGSSMHNQKLSTQRAVTVFESLKTLGRQSQIALPPERIEVLGRGEAGGPQNVKNQENRRVDILIVPSGRAQLTSN